MKTLFLRGLALGALISLTAVTSFAHHEDSSTAYVKPAVMEPLRPDVVILTQAERYADYYVMRAAPEHGLAPAVVGTPSARIAGRSANTQMDYGHRLSRVRKYVSGA